MDSSTGSHGTLRVHLEWGEEACAVVANWGQACPIECSGVTALQDTHGSHPFFNIHARCAAGMCGATQAGCLTLGDTAAPVTMSPADPPTLLPWQNTCPATLLEQRGQQCEGLQPRQGSGFQLLDSHLFCGLVKLPPPWASVSPKVLAESCSPSSLFQGLRMEIRAWYLLVERSQGLWLGLCCFCLGGCAGRGGR